MRNSSRKQSKEWRERNEDVRGKVQDPQIHTEGVPERTEKIKGKKSSMI